MAREGASASSLSLGMGNVKHFCGMPANAHGPAMARGGHAIICRKPALAGNTPSRGSATNKGECRECDLTG